MDRIKVCSTAELQPGMAVRIQAADGTPVAVFNVDGEFHAIADTCSHEEASLSDGFIEDDIVECPKHGAMFHIPTGEVRSLPATRSVQTYSVTVDGDDVYLGA